MQDLQLVGVHEDGEHLVLTATDHQDGQRYRLHIDEALRAAVRRDRARVGQLQIEISGGVRPKDIQARIRAGATADEVADVAGIPVEHVRRYEGPVLAEREHVCELARKMPVRQRDSSGDSPQLEVLVDERLAARGVADGTEWDAWRRDDGVWTVQLTFRAGSKDRRAQWAFDMARRTMEALDDESRWLSAVEGSDDGPIPGRRLSAVKERVYDVEADGGVREARRGAHGPQKAQKAQKAQVSRPTPVPDEAPAPLAPARLGAPVDLLDALKGRRGRREPVLDLDDLDDESDPEGHDADSPVEDVPAAHPPASRPDEAVDAEILQLPEEPVPAGRRRERAQAGAGRSKAKRASVPSWDEIVFGAKRD
ncbi:MAG TPA: septation protein SepH [Actinomycetales bacterium]|nr:septation protein SepH [Actinomycetales bacterium]